MTGLTTAPSDALTFRRRLAASFESGLAGIVLALVGASLLALVLRVRSPLEPVADQIMDRTPVSIAIPLLLRLESFSRPLALLGAVAVSMAVGGLLAVVYPFTGSLRSIGNRSGQTVGPLATVRVLLAVAGMACYVLVLFPGDSRIVEIAEGVLFFAAIHFTGYPIEHSPSRREFLLHNVQVLGGIGILVGLLYIGPLVDQFRANEAGRRLFSWKPPRPRKSGFNLEGLSPEITPTAQFYVMDEVLQDPDIIVQNWTLLIEGMVQRPEQLSFADLLNLQRQDQIVTQECVSNPVAGPLMSTALFSGVPIRTLIDRAGLLSSASAVLFRSPDGHEEAIPLQHALDPATLLAYACNGELLSQSRGFPARLLLPGYYGYKSLKWVDTIRLTTDPTQGHWERNGWNALPPVQTMSRIDVARPVVAGVLVAGVAFAGRRGIREVQVRINRGSWHQAELHTPALSPFSWVQWRISLPARGNLVIEVRAVDGAGRVQTARRREQKPSGATGYHFVQVTV